MFLTTQQVANRTKGKSPSRAMKRAREASSVAAAKATQAATLSMQGAASAIQSKKAQAAAQSAAAAAQAAAANASEAAQAAAQAAAVNMRKQVGTGIHGARSWAAPRLESAADYTTKTAAPKVSSALRKTARRSSRLRVAQSGACSPGRRSARQSWPPWAPAPRLPDTATARPSPPTASSRTASGRTARPRHDPTRQPARRTRTLKLQ